MIDRETLGRYILWFIGQKEEGAIRRVIDRKVVKFSKKESGKATTDEIMEFVNESFKPKAPTKRTVYRALEDLRKAKTVKYAGTIKGRTRFSRKRSGKSLQEGTTGTYTLPIQQLDRCCLHYSLLCFSYRPKNKPD